MVFAQATTNKPSYRLPRLPFHQGFSSSFFLTTGLFYGTPKVECSNIYAHARVSAVK